MQVSVENTSAIGRRLTVQIPVQRVQLECQQKMESEMKHRRLDGFRPGKIPKAVVQKKFGSEIRHKAIGALIESTLPAALKQESLEPVGRPEIEEVLNIDQEQEDLTYIVHFEVYPTIPLPGFSSMSFEKWSGLVSEEDIDEGVEHLQNQFASWASVEEPAQMGDRLMIDYDSTINGKPFEHSTQQQVAIELGSHRFIEGFEEGLVGAKAGDERHLELSFPSDWRMEKLAGKAVHFDIQIQEVSRKELAKIDSELARRIQAIGEDEAAIRQKVKIDLERHLSNVAKEQLKEQLLKEVYKDCTFSLPKVLIQQEMSLMHEDLHRRMGDKAKPTCDHHGLEEDAIRRVTLSLLFREIVQLEKLIPREDKVKEKISQIAASYGNAEFIERMYYETEDLLQQVQNTVLVDQAVEWMLSQVKIVDKAVSAKDILERQGVHSE